MVEEKMDYATALAKAQALGFAESDPTNDVDGIDAAYKMIILGAFAFGKSLTINDLSIEGIRRLDLADIFSAQSLGYEVKLVRGQANFCWYFSFGRTSLVNERTPISYR